MMNKNPLFGFLGLILLTVLAGFCSAAIGGVSISQVTTIPNPLTPGSSYPVSVLVANNNGSNILVEWVNTSSSSNTIWTALPANSTINNGSTETYSATLYVPSSFNDSTSRILKANVYSGENLLGTIQTSFTLNYTASNDDDDDDDDQNPSDYYCDSEVGTLKLDGITIENSGSGDDEEWHPLDEIEITVDVKNRDSNDRVDDVLVDIKILDESGNDITSDFDLDSDEYDIGNIKKKDVKSATFIIKEVPANINEGEYRIYIKAFSDEDEDSQCVSVSNDFNEDYYYKIDYVRDEDPAVIIKTSEMKVSASCGDKGVPVSFDVYNIGLNKEEKVLITIDNKELGIHETQFIGSLNSGKSREVTFLVDIPEDLAKTSYNLKIMTFFDYRGSRYDENEINSYDTSSDDVDGSYTMKVEVLNCQMPEPTINAKLDSEAKVGENLVFHVSITNNANSEKDVDFSISNYEEWADVVSISPESATLKAGETKKFEIILSPTSDGSQSFNIAAIIDGQTFEQSLLVKNIMKESGLFGNLDNISIYLLIGIGVVMLLILLVLIVRFAKR